MVADPSLAVHLPPLLNYILVYSHNLFINYPAKYVVVAAFSAFYNSPTECIKIMLTMMNRPI